MHYSYSLFIILSIFYSNFCFRFKFQVLSSLLNNFISADYVLYLAYDGYERFPRFIDLLIDVFDCVLAKGHVMQTGQRLAAPEDDL